MKAQMMTYTLDSTVGSCDANTVSAGLFSEAELHVELNLDVKAYNMSFY